MMIPSDWGDLFITGFQILWVLQATLLRPLGMNQQPLSSAQTEPSHALLLLPLLVVIMPLFFGCASSRPCCPDIVRPEVYQRVASYLTPASFAGDIDDAGDVAVPDDSLDEDALIQLALENNKTFRAALAQLGMAQGDWVQAGLLTNPNLANFIPVGVKQWEWILYLPIESFLLRPDREAIAHDDYHRIASGLVQSGLTLVRDVRVAQANFALAVAQQQLALEALQIRGQINELTQKRLEGGDIGELEAIQAKIDAATAKANVATLQQNVDVTRNRLHTLIGMPNNAQPIRPTLTVPDFPFDLDEPFLVSRALETRPDMRAARWAVDAARARRRLSRWMFWRVDGVVDANSKGQNGYEVGPGIRLDVPIFNRNQGGILRADAEICQAIHNRDAMREQIIEEVRSAVAQIQQTHRGLSILTNEVVPTLAETITIAQQGYEDGGIDYLLVLQTTRNYLDVRANVLDQTAAVRRAIAELERSIAGPLAAVERLASSSDGEMVIGETEFMEKESDEAATE